MKLPSQYGFPHDSYIWSGPPAEKVKPPHADHSYECADMSLFTISSLILNFKGNPGECRGVLSLLSFDMSEYAQGKEEEMLGAREEEQNAKQTQSIFLRHEKQNYIYWESNIINITMHSYCLQLHVYKWIIIVLHCYLLLILIIWHSYIQETYHNIRYITNYIHSCAGIFGNPTKHYSLPSPPKLKTDDTMN